MDLELANERAIVFGGANGIGRAIGAAFLAEGASLFLADISPSVHETAAELGANAERRVQSLRVDVTDESSVRIVAEMMARDPSPCDHLVCAFGVGSGKYGFPFWNLEPADWKRVVEVNLLGVAHVAHAFAASMVRARRGTMLFLASIAGQIGSQTDPPYSAAKAGVINFAQCAAKDLAPYGVRVNTICPGMIKTALQESIWAAWNARQPATARLSFDDWAQEKIRRVVPLGHWQSPDDVAAMAVFLASKRAANITGQTINVDGGQVMHS